MTFKEALDTGCRIQNGHLSYVDDYNNYWYKKINEKEFIFSLEPKKRLIIEYIDTLMYIGTSWFIHPEDQKLIDFNKNLEEILK